MTFQQPFLQSHMILQKSFVYADLVLGKLFLLCWKQSETLKDIWIITNF